MNLVGGWPGHFLLANGRGAVLDETEPLARETFLVVADIQGKAQNARIMSAAVTTLEEIEDCLADRLEIRTETEFDKATGAVRQREEIRLGAIVLRKKSLPPPKGEDADNAIVAAVHEHGLDILSWDDRTKSLRQRLQWLHNRIGSSWPSMGDAELLSGLDDWLRPFLTGGHKLNSITARSIEHGLLSLLPDQLAREVESHAPTHYRAPTGSRTAIDYEGEVPVLAIRVQELYSLQKHPSIAGGTVPLKLELLSPARRPIQSTLDLPGFWRGSWADVRIEMKGRYPKHVWPECPDEAEPTTRAKPRGK